MSVQNWCELPVELLRAVAEKIGSLEDFLRFRGVCHSWRSSVWTLDCDKRHFSSILKPPPWLMLTADEGDMNRRFISVLDNNKYYNLSFPEASGCRCWGSPFGWMVTLGFDQQLHILNPLSRPCGPLQLPPLSAFRDRYFSGDFPGENRMRYIQKATITNLPSPSTKNDDRFLVFAIFSGFSNLAFARPGDRVWTTVKFNAVASQRDVIYFNSQYYSVDAYGITWLCNIDGPNPMGVKFATPPEDLDHDERFYLVELRGELHLAVRFLDFPEDPGPIESQHLDKTYYIEVYKLDMCTQKWQELDTLGDYSLFVGSNASFSLKATDYPGCKPNCVYFTDDNTETYGQLLGHDMGIFNLETEAIEPLYAGNDILSRYSPPVWITPNLF